MYPRERRGARLLEWIGIGVVALAGWGALAWFQLAEPVLYDGDSYVHVRAAQQLREHGVRKEMPQAWFSTWREHYSDKDLLFHALLAIGAGEKANLVTTGKVAVLAFDAVLLALLAAGLVRMRARYGAFWLLLFLVSHPWIAIQLAEVRPHLLGMAFVLAEVLALIGRRPVLLGVLAAFHIWGHTSWVLLPALVGAHFVANWLRAEPLPWRIVAAAAVGVAFGNLAHPYFPNNLTIAMDQIVWVARSVWVAQPDLPRVIFGGELSPMTWRAFVQTAPGWAPVLVGAVAARVFARERAYDVAGWTLLLSAGGLFFAAVMTNRFMAFFLPVGAWTAAYFWTAVVIETAEKQPARRVRPGFVLAAAFLLACVASGLQRGHVIEARRSYSGAYSVETARDAVAYLDEVAAPGDLVFHDFWWPFSPLYYYRPDGRYVVGLDPIFFYRFDPERFASALRLHRGERVDAHAILTEEFGARWVLVQRLPRHHRFWALLMADPRIRVVYEDEWALIFEVAPL